MDCRIARDRVASWLEGELSAADAELLEDHLEHCESCRVLAERLSQQEAVLRLVKPPPFDRLEGHDFWDRMDSAMDQAMERRQAEDRRAARLWRRSLGARVAVPVPFAALVVLSLVVALAWGIGQQQELGQAQDEAAQAGMALEREQRLSAAPTQAVRAGSFRTSMRTPVRGSL